MSNLCRYALLYFLFIFLNGCNSETVMSPAYVVKKKPLTITLSAFGEIEASQAQRIIAPGRSPMTIEWLAPENSQVKKGDVIVRFDAEQITINTRIEELEVLMIEQDILQNEVEQLGEFNDIQAEQSLVGEEFVFTDRFAIEDIRVYSRLEIIEILQNRDFLEAKDDFLKWREQSVSQQTQSSTAVLDIQKEGHEQKYDLYKQSLLQLEIYAPFDGLLTYEKDENSEKPSVGQTVFPGKVIANIPNLNNLRATVYVLARDAINLQKDLPVELRLNAKPEKTIFGHIQHVAGFPRPIERGNPVTYFEVTVKLDNQHLAPIRPGSKVKASISNKVSDSALLVPLQALEHDQSSSYVKILKNDGWHKTRVTTGAKNNFFVEITEGIEVGDQVSLAPLDSL